MSLYQHILRCGGKSNCYNHPYSQSFWWKNFYFLLSFLETRTQELAVVQIEEKQRVVCNVRSNPLFSGAVSLIFHCMD